MCWHGNFKKKGSSKFSSWANRKNKKKININIFYSCRAQVMLSMQIMLFYYICFFDGYENIQWNVYTSFHLVQFHPNNNKNETISSVDSFLYKIQIEELLLFCFLLLFFFCLCNARMYVYTRNNIQKEIKVGQNESVWCVFVVLLF